MSYQAAHVLEADAWPPRSTVAFLLKVALLGVDLQRFEDARELLLALQQLRPDLPHVQLAQAYLQSRALGLIDARHLLLSIVDGFPDCQMGVAMLSLLDREANTSGWQGLAESVLQDGRDEAAIKLCRFVLGMRSESSEDRPSGALLHHQPIH